MQLDPEIVKIQDDFHAANRLKKRWILVEETDGTVTVHAHTIDGVAPPTTYPDRKKAVSRVMQLMETGIAAPQSWPEEVCVGTVTRGPTKPYRPNPFVDLD